MPESQEEIRDWHPASICEVAGRCEQGERGLVGLASFSGVVGAPLAMKRRAGPTQVAVGLLLGLVLVAAGAGLVLTMSAAYGSVRLVRAPGSRTELQRLRWSLAERDRARLVWSCRLAIGFLVLVAVAVAVAVAWLDPASHGSGQLQVETDAGVTHCGRVLHAAHGTVAVRTKAEGRVKVPAGDVVAVDVVETCEQDHKP